MPYTDPEKQRQATKVWKQSPEGRESQRRYNNTPERKTYMREYHRTSEVRKTWLATPEAKWRRFLSRIKSNHGLTETGLWTMWAEQQGLCGICHEPMVIAPGRPDSMHVDHDHDTKQVRELVHCNCNVGIGMLGDSSTHCSLAAAYLRRHGK